MGASLVALAAVFAAIGTPTWIPPALSVRFGVPSPLTGMTRSFIAMVSGDVTAAFAWHLLGPIAFAACIAMPIVAVASLVRGRRFVLLSRTLSSKSVWLGIGVVTGLAWARQIVSL